MNTVCEIGRCNGCMVCVEKCPKKCISIIDDIYTYNAVKDKDLCINCGLCEKICPRNIENNKKKPVEWYQGWAEPQIRCTSSSGGVASSIMAQFIQNGGFVASCLFKNGEFVFDITNNVEKAKKFAGSKYVKSNPIGIYDKVAERLKTDKVLFIGLPCQVAGLKNYINNQENLYTIDLICHGTPSPKLLEKYLVEHGVKISDLKDIKFRNKVSMGLSSEGVKLCPEGVDDYLIAFLASAIYTENCYYCDYSTFERISDITLGDSWGTEYTEEEKEGVSLILVQTEKGKKMLKETNLDLRSVDIANAIRENHQLSHPSLLTPERKKFLNWVVGGKKISYATFFLWKKKIIRRNVKKMLIKLHLKNGG